jgi:hypothetical protein
MHSKIVKTKTQAAQGSGRVVHSSSRASKPASAKAAKAYSSTTIGKKR